MGRLAETHVTENEFGGPRHKKWQLLVWLVRHNYRHLLHNTFMLLENMSTIQLLQLWMYLTIRYINVHIFEQFTTWKIHNLKIKGLLTVLLTSFVLSNVQKRKEIQWSKIHSTWNCICSVQSFPPFLKFALN